MIAITLYGVNDRGIPAEWPQSVRTISNSDELLPGELGMTEEEYKLYKEQNLPAYLAWKDSLANSENVKAIADQIAAKVREKIVAFIDENEYWEFRNFYVLFRYIELLERRINGNTLTTPQEEELTEFRNYWNKIKAIQRYGDQLTRSIKRGNIVDIESGWPS